MKRVISYLLVKLMRDGNPSKHSLNLFSSRNALRCLRTAKNSQAVVNLHWINNDTLSLWRLGDLPRGTIVTLHDEWLYCGSEHYHIVESKECSFITGYDCVSNIRGINWNQWIWRLKRDQLKGRWDLIFTVPSKWMLDRANRSEVLGSHDVRILPNPIDVGIFRRAGEDVRKDRRVQLGIDHSHVVFLAGAVRGGKNPLKGFDLLLQAAGHLRQIVDEAVRRRISFVFFGGEKRREGSFAGFSAHFLGHVDNDDYLRELYSMADCTIVPSMVEAFGQVAAESLACSTPVISFRTSGLTDIVLDGETGFLAEPFCAISLAESMRRMAILCPSERLALGDNGRCHVEREFSAGVVALRYNSILEDAKGMRNLYRKNRP